MVPALPPPTHSRTATRHGAVAVWGVGIRVVESDATEGIPMITLGVILIIVALIFDVSILYTIGGILAVVGIILWILGAVGRQIGPRAHYY